ncbi:MAG: hypothetical protein J5674_00870, partial [Candidatus Methanomethylophilaceae archaeon]|nr:hypothetical protein [Candidatus Methanomethylophilaceae archaeon]
MAAGDSEHGSGARPGKGKGARYAKVRNIGSVMALAVLLGAVAGLVLWLFLQAVSIGSSLVWDAMPSVAGGKWIAVPICAIGGCAIGLMHRRY